MSAAAVRRRPPWWVWAIGAVLAAIGLTAALGGFADVPVERLPRVALGDEHVGNAVTTTVHSVVVQNGRPSSGFDDGETSFVLLEVTATNTGTTPTSAPSDIVRILIDGVVDEFEVPAVTDPRDGNGVLFLQPGVETELDIWWEVDRGTVEPGDDVVIGFFERYAATDDPRFDDAKTAPIAVARIDTTIGGTR